MTKRIFGQPGFCIVPDIRRPAADKIAALGAYAVAVTGDSLGRRCIMDSAIKPLDPSMKLRGPAITVEVHPADNLMIHAALKLARPGDVLVVNARGDTQHGVWGEITTSVAARKKLGGLVIDGAVRDRLEIVESGFPVFCRAVAPLGGGKEGPGQVNLPVSCGGLAVNPGDVVVGDADGVLVIPADMLDVAIEGAEKKRVAEEKRLSAIRDGGDDEIYPSWLIPTLRAKGVLGEEETI